MPQQNLFTAHPQLPYVEAKEHHNAWRKCDIIIDDMQYSTEQSSDAHNQVDWSTGLALLRAALIGSPPYTPQLNEVAGRTICNTGRLWPTTLSQGICWRKGGPKEW